MFSGEFDDEFSVGAEGNNAFVGRDVLRGLVNGLDDYIHGRQERWRQPSRSLGPIVLGAAGWINDPEFIAKLKEFSGACIVVTKQGRSSWDLKKLEVLHRANAEIGGLPLGAFPDLAWMAPHVGGHAVVVGPYDRADDVVLPAIRTLGFRARWHRTTPRRRDYGDSDGEPMSLSRGTG